jgi:hypothetical protein
MNPRIAFSLAAFVFIAGCGRSELYPSDLEALASSGYGGAGAGGRAAGGTSGRAGASSGGGKPSMAGAAMVAGMPSDGGSIGVAGEGGAGGAAIEDCLGGQLHIVQVDPVNATSAFDSSKTVRVWFDCPYDTSLLDGNVVRLHGQQRGYVEQLLTWTGGELGFHLVPFPPAFAAGERVTAWVGSELGGPYLWQYMERVAASSPGQFVVGTQDLSVLDRAYDAALADFDGDRDLDLVVGWTGQAMQLWLNVGAAQFEDQGPLASQGAPTAADVDHDGDLDVFSDDGALLWNNGDATFESGPSFIGCSAPGDFDGDGDLDCIESVGYRADRTTYGYVLFNRGAPTFEEGPETPFGFECEVADLDGDADLDAVCITADGAHAFSNDGKGAFKRSPQRLGQDGTRAIALGDVDGDHDVDVLVAVWFGGGKSTPNEVWLNDGKGTLTESGSFGAQGGDVELGDLDGDGDLDIVASKLTPYGPSWGPFNSALIYENDGMGAFSETGRTLGDPAFQWLKLGDLDGDGDLDAFVFHQVATGKNYSAVWLNQK